MRWKFDYLDPNYQADPARAQVESRIANWWSAFEDRQGDVVDLFAGRSGWDLPGWMHDTLQAIHPELKWEFGPGVAGGHRLVITPEAAHELRPLVGAILAAAPKRDQWEFYGTRLREPFDILAPTISARCGSDMILTGACAKPGQFNRVDLIYTRKRKLFRNNDDQAFQQAFVSSETLLGEACLNQWIGSIDLARKVDHPVLLPGLASHVDDVIDATTSRLPPQPYGALAEDAEWTGLELKPEPADDFEGWDDLFVAMTADFGLWEACHIDPLFSSRRFSRHGEVFCYLKIDGSPEFEGSSFSNRGDIADAISEALSRRGVGGIIGGGTGIRYAYVDLALSNVEEAVPIIQDVVQSNKLSKRSWLHFFDADLRNEWVRMWADSPEPPSPR